MKVKEFMTSDVKTCMKDDTVRDAAQLMWTNKFSVVPVVDKNGRLEGIVTESDFVGKDVEIPHALGSIKGLFGELFLTVSGVESIYREAQSKKLSEIMTEYPQIVTPDSGLDEVVNLMNSRELKRIPVVENGKVVGIVTRKDLIKAFLTVNTN